MNDLNGLKLIFRFVVMFFVFTFSNRNPRIRLVNLIVELSSRRRPRQIHPWVRQAPSVLIRTTRGSKSRFKHTLIFLRRKVIRDRISSDLCTIFIFLFPLGQFNRLQQNRLTLLNQSILIFISFTTGLLLWRIQLAGCSIQAFKRTNLSSHHNKMMAIKMDHQV